MFAQLGVIGCGLMGGSFALALKEAGLVQRVVGYSRSETARSQALSLGVIDATAHSAAQAAQGSDLVLLAVPVAATEATLREVADHLGPGTLCMDVGSTKGNVVEAAQRALRSLDARSGSPTDRALQRFVPAHPIAGKESAGVEHADGHLYRDRLVVLTPLAENPKDLVSRARQTWEAVGARVEIMTAQAHDAAFAAVSHLPHLLAFAYMKGLMAQADGSEFLRLAGTGFRDFSRIAGSDPVVWRDILLGNGPQVLQQLAEFRSALQTLENLVRDGDGAALQALIAEVAPTRRNWQLTSSVSNASSSGSEN